MIPQVSAALINVGSSIAISLLGIDGNNFHTRIPTAFLFASINPLGRCLMGYDILVNGLPATFVQLIQIHLWKLSQASAFGGFFGMIAVMSGLLMAFCSGGGHAKLKEYLCGSVCLLSTIVGLGLAFWFAVDPTRSLTSVDLAMISM